jgi:hypothetical protein
MKFKETGVKDMLIANVKLITYLQQIRLKINGK